jgi:hypothetical protein
MKFEIARIYAAELRIGRGIGCHNGERYWHQPYTGAIITPKRLQEIAHAAGLRVWSVKLSDRKYSRKLCAESSRAALERVVGARLIGARESARVNGVVHFAVSVANGGKKDGITPIKMVSATVHYID